MRRLTLILVAMLIAGCGGGTAAQRTDTPAAPVVTAAPAPETPSPGSGVITFGTAYNADSLLIAKPLTTFKRTVKTIAWSAEFSESAGATTVKFVFASVSKGGAESIIDQEDVAISSPTFDLLANKANLATVAGNKAGTYVLRYIRKGTVLAEGTFTLTK
jgi:hypothetical protein